MIARNVVLDTTYLMPAFGIDIEVDSSRVIEMTLGRLREREGRVYISDLSPFEAFIKSYRIAEKLKDNIGKETAKSGFLAISKEGWVNKVDHKDEEIVEEAYKIREGHNDPFDCFIFATAKALSAPLVTEDRDALRFLEHDQVLSWADLKRRVKA